ncbi:MAG: WbqC family protein [Candidatus Thorarchaeota archaeon]
MRIAIHQPNYLPWLGYFYKIHASDVFVFHDNVEYTKGYIKRSLIRKTLHSKDTRWLTVPVQKHNDYEKIANLRIANLTWTKDHLNRIRNIYRNAPFFDSHFNEFESYLNTSVTNCELLADLNIALIQWICKRIGLKEPSNRSSNLSVNGYKSEYNAKLAEFFGATVYLSGSGARNYNNPQDFEARGIHLTYSDFHSFLKDNPYYQPQGEYIPGLTILDALFNVDVEGISHIFDEYDTHLRTQ